jgi:hypothetical protein
MHGLGVFALGDVDDGANEACDAAVGARKVAL